ncbi:peptidase M24, structural domain-containing protein [Cantharellus anzutake]|uniref:peptidase M24, structural domain-containing protein n=1 Tax=Cantharellus anzutake TaxID=1750568 RepID=UPI00190401A7|nr:peptidase M24, structural domain-containing protein [Cantharellus anzutake]KAF8326347.1 peptidase M24, structural domain-containing protein [Cantharellus anzutake]
MPTDASTAAKSPPHVITCQSDNCPNGKPPARLECPTCHKLGITGSFFCEQACFRENCECTLFKSHKQIHEFVKASAITNPFPSYRFTGSLRPVYPLSPRRVVPDHIPRPDYAEDSIPHSELKSGYSGSIKILTKQEQEGMRAVSRLAREVLDIAASHIRPAITTDEIDAIVHEACIERGAYPSPLNYRRFPKSVCTSVNEVICHGIPDQRKLVEGDIINLDVTLYHNGFHGDVNATYPVGEISEESRKLIDTTRRCLDEAIKICKPGAFFRDLGKVIEPIAQKSGCSVVRQYTGHGIHRLFHCVPNIPHYAKNKAVGQMKEGMCFTIEPMINLGNRHDAEHWPDDWTAVTVDGNRSAQFEETLLVTADGVEVLTRGP